MFKELSGDQYGLKNIPQDSISTFIDIGAAYGLVSILARLLHTKMRIIALEPHNTTCAYLSHNVSNMGIVTFNAAYGTGCYFVTISAINLLHANL
jgi:FkbM family methyltransferase